MTSTSQHIPYGSSVVLPQEPLVCCVGNKAEVVSTRAFAPVVSGFDVYQCSKEDHFSDICFKSGDTPCFLEDLYEEVIAEVEMKAGEMLQDQGRMIVPNQLQKKRRVSD